MNGSAPQANPAEIPPAVARSRRLPLLLFAVLLVAAAALAAHYFLVGRFHAQTDDAYVNGNIIRLAPQVSGTVVAFGADETQYVRQGQPLAQLDNQDTDVALAQAEAALAQTVREVVQLRADERRDEAAVAAQRVQLRQASEDLARDRTLAAAHGVSEQALQHDEHAVRSAQAALEQAQAALAASRAAVSGTTPYTHPRVLQARASLHTAWLAAARTHVLSPASGYVIRRSVQLGQQVTPATELLALVPLESIWIDANFKETQLGCLRIGQAAQVTADIYGTRVQFHGKVLGLIAGTGSALAVLPAQNASGNWIKVVQRLPVRIGLDPAELAAHPLFVGASTHVDVDTHSLDGAALSQAPAWPAAANTDVYAAQSEGFDALAERIVGANIDTSSAAVGQGPTPR
ncbi:MAG: efflux RND transporter periplasmic adaptor subunit [Nevskia sp.]|nr:efflux RND transporter periplasmic adaptor subunit [Nevskia sp.]